MLNQHATLALPSRAVDFDRRSREESSWPVNVVATASTFAQKPSASSLKENLIRTRVLSELGIPESSVSRWVKQAQRSAGQGWSSMLTTEERSEWARLWCGIRLLKRKRENEKQRQRSSPRRCRAPLSVYPSGKGLSFGEATV